MRTPARSAVAAAAIIGVLAVAGIGAVLAAGPTSAVVPASDLTGDSTSLALGAVETEAPAGGRPDARLGPRARWTLGLGRHLVHAEITIVGRDDELIDIWLDHGTVASIDGTMLVITEAGGATRTVVVDDATRVFVGRTTGALGDLAAGAEVFVRSRVDDGTAVAKAILVIPTDRR